MSTILQLLRLVLAAGHAAFLLYLLVTISKMKLSTAVVVLSLSGASAYSVTRSSLRSLGQKTVSVKSPSRSVEPQMKMEGKGPCIVCSVHKSCENLVKTCLGKK